MLRISEPIYCRLEVHEAACAAFHWSFTQCLFPADIERFMSDVRSTFQPLRKQ